MQAKSRTGVAVGSISMVISILCFVVTPAFTPAFMVAVLLGVPGAAIALAHKARRTAIAAFVFAFMPCGFLFPERTGLTLMGLGLAIVAWVLIDYLRSRPSTPSAAA